MIKSSLVSKTSASTVTARLRSNIKPISQPRMIATQAGDSNGDAITCTHRAYIALGSNIGDRIAMIERACAEMNRVGIKVKRTSSLFETAPMYVLDQEPFLNAACEVCLP